MNNDFNLGSAVGQQDFKNWVSRTIKNEINSYSRQALVASNNNPLNSALASNSVIIPSGIIVPFAGSTAPTGWLLCNGQSVDRNTYSNLFSAITVTYPNAILNSTFTITNLSNVNTDWTAGGVVGWSIAGDGISSGSFINSSTSTSINSNLITTKTGTSSIVISPYGFSGANNTTTFNIPDLRGRVAAGRDTMDSPFGAANRITPTYTTYGNVLGNSLGDQIQSHVHYGEAQGGNLAAAIGAIGGNVRTIGYVAGSVRSPGPGSCTYYIDAPWGGAVAFSHYTPVYGNTSDASNLKNVQPTLITNYIIKT